MEVPEEIISVEVGGMIADFDPNNPPSQIQTAEYGMFELENGTPVDSKLQTGTKVFHYKCVDQRGLVLPVATDGYVETYINK